jgi:hypothetical protein
MTSPADLPPPAMVPYRRHTLRHPCPRCGPSASRDKPSQRTLHDLGTLDLWGPRALGVTDAPHDCTQGRKDFHRALSALAPPGRPYPHRVRALAVRLVVAAGGPSRPPRWPLWRDHRVVVPCATIPNGVEAGGKKGAGAPGPGLP